MTPYHKHNKILLKENIIKHRLHRCLSVHVNIKKLWSDDT